MWSERKNSPEFETERIALPDDYEGKAAATLVKSPSPAHPGRAVLYLHGYIDYFFQTHLAERFVADGYRFYALDLRRYGRSLLPGQRPYYVRSLADYYPEIDRVVETIRAEGNDFLVLLGHSTGGLIASLYCAEGRERRHIDRLILNSPFFEFNTGWFKRKIAIPLAGAWSRMFPYARKKNELSPYYADSVHRSLRGEWDYDLTLKPREGVPLYFAWLRAIRLGQRKVKRGLHLTIPVLVLHSDRSSWHRTWHEDYTRTDAVLNVAHIRRYAARLGDDVTDAEIPGGLHDLALSRKEARELFFRTMEAWPRERGGNAKAGG